jgi:endonuclease YncB( thermonuclease family)
VAAKALSDLIGRQTVTCEKKDIDRYKRIVAVCSVNGQDVGSYLVAMGLAVAYVHYSSTYLPAETAARSGGLGLWAGKFEMPWDWRKAH